MCFSEWNGPFASDFRDVPQKFPANECPGDGSRFGAWLEVVSVRNRGFLRGFGGAGERGGRARGISLRYAARRLLPRASVRACSGGAGSRRCESELAQL